MPYYKGKLVSFRMWKRTKRIYKISSIVKLSLTNK